mgnify:CR=1 FL=1
MLPGTANTGFPYRSAWPTVDMVPLFSLASTTTSAPERAAMRRLRCKIPRHPPAHFGRVLADDAAPPLDGPAEFPVGGGVGPVDGDAHHRDGGAGSPLLRPVSGAVQSVGQTLTMTAPARARPRPISSAARRPYSVGFRSPPFPQRQAH